MEFNQELLINWGTKALIAIAILVVGYWLIKQIVNVIKKGLSKKELDPAVVSFIGNIISVIGFVAVLIAAMSQLGIDTTSMVAVLGAAGLAVGLALQSSLSNFASGIIIVTLRPFKAGDFVEAGGCSGTVCEIKLFSTTLTTPDNKVVMVPNSSITGDTITNFSKQDTRRVDLTIGVSYDADIKKTKEVLASVLDKESRILPDPAYMIGLHTLADSSVNYVVRSWVNSADYWPVYFDLMENIKYQLDANDIGIPYPQMDLHIRSNPVQGKES